MNSFTKQFNTDPFGFDVFESIEAYEDIISSLSGLYTNLHVKALAQDSPNTVKADYYLQMLNDIRLQKNRFSVGDVVSRNRQTTILTKEFNNLVKEKN